MSVGVTGHQNLGDEDTTLWITGTLRRELLHIPFDFGLTCLAVGADQLFAELLLASGSPYEAVLPSAKYDTVFVEGDARERFHSLLQRARCTHQLSFAAPSDEAYFAAGKWIVSHCELLVAVWDGLPARGLGGTGDVVTYARSIGRAVLQIDPVKRVVSNL